MDQLQVLCDNAKNFPLNVADGNGLSYRHKSIFSKLNEQEKRLFCRENRAVIDILDYGPGRRDWWKRSIKNMDDLRSHLGVQGPSKKRDPWCRFLFVHAPNSRTELNTTREMLTLAMTYHQIMPEFVDLIFPFGNQRRAQDFHFTAFRQRTRLSARPQGLQIRELGWSGRDIQVCYNLKSVEYSVSQSHRPWSIRHGAISHSFDMENARATWIIIKGNKILQERMIQATSIQGLPEFQNIKDVGGAFAASLTVHKILCDWAAEGWRWYINYLEEKHKDIERRTVSNEIDVPPTSPTQVLDEFSADKSETSILSKFSRTRRQTMESLASIGEKRESTFPSDNANSRAGVAQPQSPIEDPEPETNQQQDSIRLDEYGQQEFSFRDLQDLHSIDVKANEAALVIKHVLSILLQLVSYYQFTFQHKEFPQEIAESCGEAMSHFVMHVKGVEMDLQMQASRIETLQRSIADCKTLLHSILDFQNAQSNKALARESRASTMNMEQITVEMNDIARKTKTETVSMKIITLVTLFFLPGTFISTLMSTDIFQSEDVRHQGPDPYHHLSPLQLYLAASLPLTAVTLLVWGVFYWVERHTERITALRSYAQRAAHRAMWMV